ncbi:hypothetical protein NX02_06670 [Sphingomonas sanxanigenens DSM 19645 = NX02]|uniref:Uncharacterized protein n=1 Tax=Sphingomonas sanxanigenens DSM 19645 = NX02 TaxID=1123269 RepID=W0A547_9SPHN|nr:hypothetical protein NX02_06670 [Sphingomonas sanxanigenens DSM 19645 = NX02]
MVTKSDALFSYLLTSMTRGDGCPTTCHRLRSSMDSTAFMRLIQQAKFLTISSCRLLPFTGST